jgi:hypothetical protein
MKRIRSHIKLNLVQQKRQTRLFERRKKKKRLKSGSKNLKTYGGQEKLKIELNAPKVFCFTKNTVGMIEFLDKLETAVDNNDQITIDLSEINDLSTDATLAIVAKATNPNRKSDSKIFITIPNSELLSDKLFDSGIFGKEERIFSNGEFRKPKGIIERKNDVSVKSEETSELIRFATKQLFGNELRFQQLQRVFVECMNNTINHASIDKEEKESWWASVYYDEAINTARFNFFDNGIGILESINLRWQDKILNKVGWKDSAKIMKDALAGEVGSRTGLSYRGKGLPAILEAFNQGCITKLIIISNDVYVNLEKNEYANLEKSFKGTFFHWEINEQQRNFCRS